MVAQWRWLLVACIAASAAAREWKVEETEEQKKVAQDLHEHLVKLKKTVDVPLAVECCKAEKVVPKIYKKMTKECYELAVDMYRSTNDSERVAKSCPMMDCFLKENKLLDEDKFIDVEGTKTLVMEKARKGVEDITKKALSKCFVEHNKKKNREVCESGSVQLFACIMYDILINCPKNLWHYKTKPECHDNYSK